jgi:hypothetical protein
MLEPRILFAYPQMSSVTGAPNPMNGVNVGADSHPAFGDLDGDGDLDVVVGQSQFVRYFKNTGTATAPAYTQIIGLTNPFRDLALGNVASNPALADLDADGDLDLVLGSGLFTRYFRNTGSATFPSFAEQTGAANPFTNVIIVDGNPAPAFADFDGDGDLDALVGELGGILHYYKNNGTANGPLFQNVTNPFSGIDVGDNSVPAPGDMDGDGDIDVLVGDSSGAVRYFKNTGTATNFVYVQQTGAANPFNGVSVPGAAPAAGDLDGDGDIDVLAGSQVGTLSYFRSAAVTPAVNYQTNAANPMNGVNVGQFSNPTFGDMDGDGDLDAVVGQTQFLRYFKNTGTATAPVYVQQIGATNLFVNLVLSNTVSNPALADLDADGDLDLVVGSNVGMRYFRNTGSATTLPFFTEQTGAANPLGAFGVDGNSAPTLADLDGDGDLDALVGELGGILHYYRNDGTANSPAFQVAPVNPFAGLDVGDNSIPAPGDFDGDGDLDVVIGNLAGAMRYFKNTGSATNPVYVEQTGAANPFNGVSIPGAAPAAGDLDGDGDPDVLVGSQMGTLPYFRANVAPIVDNPMADQTFSGAGAKSYTVPADTFLDLEGNALTYSATLTSGAALPAWLSFNATTRQFSGNPSRLDASPLQIRVTANDGQGAAAFDDFQLTLTNVGDMPVAVNDSYSINQDTTLTANGIAPNPAGALANDLNPDGLPLSATVVALPSHGSVNMSSNGSFIYTPAAGYNGPDSFTYRSSDGLLLSNTATVSITIIDNVRPTVQASQFVFETAPHRVTIRFSEDVSASLSAADFAVTTVPSGASVPFTYSYDIATNTASLGFFATLPDGNYHARVLAAGISDPAGNTMATNHDLDFFVLAGDANRDRRVDLLDFNMLASNFGQPNRTFSQGDFNYDGTVNLSDFNILASHFGQSLGPDGNRPDGGV